MTVSARNPGDEYLRNLERLARQGDRQARAALKRERARRAPPRVRPLEAMRRVYILRYDGGVMEELGRTTLTRAREEARAGARVGWEPADETHWVDVAILDSRGNAVETVTTAIDPEEPDCTEPAHDWQDECVRGSGGGVRITETCRHCRRTKTTDTWAQRRDTGEQGLLSLEYGEPGRFGVEGVQS